MAEESREPVSEQVRSACAWVAGRARSVRIDESAIPTYAAALPSAVEAAPPDSATDLIEADGESRAAFVLCLDAINFGSGWWPTIRKRPGRSGYFTIATGLTERFRERGPWTPAELGEIGRAEIATVLDQDPEHPLVAHFVTALRAGWGAFADVSVYEGCPVPFFKRAQIAAADVARAALAELRDLDG